MALSFNEFKVLAALNDASERMSQRKLATQTGLSLGSINRVVSGLENKQLISSGTITDAGLTALKPYRVSNAVIMAAGLSSRFAPISYEKPKGLLKVRGEVLIERQIEQLQAAGICDITVVVGYKKEYFFYLAQKYGVDIVVNAEYSTKNNHSSLMCVKDKLDNTYICSSDDYFIDNPFEPYVYRAYYASTYVEGTTSEWCITTGAHDVIEDVVVGGSDSWIMLGHVYFDRKFSSVFKRILEEEYPLPQTADKLWETLYIEHIKELPMVIRRYPDGFINEFDSLDELKDFDPYFLRNVDSDIFDNICSVLNCDIEEVGDFYPLKQGLTNLSCHFSVGKNEYVYRHPGVGTEKLVDRASEKAALELASELAIDSTFIFEDPQAGWKISRFIPNAQTLNPASDEHLKRAMEASAKLHDSGAHLDRTFDFVQESLKYETYLTKGGCLSVPGYQELKDKVLRLKKHADADGFPVCLSHNDFFHLNFLIDTNDNLNLIDWEYAGMSDIASDFGTFVVCSELTPERADKALNYYFGRTPTKEERRHFWAYIVFAGWCWYVWSLTKEAEGENVNEWLYIYYSYASNYVDTVLSWYENGIET